MPDTDRIVKNEIKNQPSPTHSTRERAKKSPLDKGRFRGVKDAISQSKIENTIMTLHFNRGRERKKRKALRNNPTKAEQILWKRLKGRQIDGFKIRRQYSIDGFIIDFYCIELKLAIEIDGDSHFVNKDAIEYDLDREYHIKKYGVTFLRFTNNEVIQNLDAVVEKIQMKLKELENE